MTNPLILTLNAGSSSIKFSLYRAGHQHAEPDELLRGQVENLGPAARLLIEPRGEAKRQTDIGAADHAVALRAIIGHARTTIGDESVAGVGHRIAHGGIDYTAPRALDFDTLGHLRALAPLAPLHQPHNLAAVTAAINAFPDARQIGCFDTSFHRNQPWVNDTFALPRRYYDKGVRRYGFHGLSYEYVVSELQRIAPEVAMGRVVIAHLGNGASMCAVAAGRSVASTMGFSPLDGLPMGTRCGQLDPGVMLYLMDQEGLSAPQISDLLYLESGLKGLSGQSHDMRELLKSDSPEAGQAVDYFVFRVRRELGAMAAVLGGLDVVVFCGGIGEHAIPVRSRVCDGMDFLGIKIDAQRNTANEIDVGTGPTRIMVIATDEERTIARAVQRALHD